MAFFGAGFDPTVPQDTAPVAQGASILRALKLLLQQFLTVSFNLETGQILPAAIPNPMPTPFGSAGAVLTSAGASLQPVWGAPQALPIGFLGQWPVATPPTGFLVCDGSTKVIATYPALAAVLGMTFGGDGITTFGLPDFRGRAPVGAGTGDAGDATAWSSGQKKGEETHTIVANELPEADFTFTNIKPYGGSFQNGPQGPGVLPWVTGTGNTIFTNPLGGGGLVHNNLQPSLGIYFIIKAL